jgi:hypothetical protein
MGCAANGHSPDPAPRAAFLVLTGGDQQRGPVGTTLPASIAASVLDANGAPVPGHEVRFAVTAGDAQVIRENVRTGPSGEASTSVTFGTRAGGVTVEARAPGLAGSPVVYRLTALPGPAARLVAVSGDNQGGIAGETLAEALVVAVRDVYANAVPGIEVTFTVTSGAASLRPALDRTGADGQVRTLVMLGAATGSVTVHAAVPGLAAVTFQATIWSAQPRRLRAVSGDGQSAPAGATLPQPLVVAAEDDGGSPVAGVTVSFAVIRGGGSVGPGSARTDARGHAETQLTLGSTAGENAVEASATELTGSPVTFRATATTPPGPTARPVVLGYVETLHGEMQISDINIEAVDYVVHGFLWPQPDGSVDEWPNFREYREAGLAARVHAAGRKIIASAGGATLSDNFSAVAADPVKRGRFVSDVVGRVVTWGYDGVDIDWEFPYDDVDKANLTTLMRELYGALKAISPSHVLMFGISTGYWIDYYDFPELARWADYGFYFGYDWNNPANGPMTHTGIQWTAADNQVESSARGVLDFILARGFPAAKLILGMPFYSSEPVQRWYEVRDAWARAAPLVPHERYLEVNFLNRWWTTPEAIARKMDAVLKPSASVLTGGATLGGVGFWEFGYEGKVPDLSSAIRTWIDVSRP